MLSDPKGDVVGGSLGGLFHEDTRFLSRFALLVNGARPSLLSSGAGEYDTAAFFLTNPDLDGIPGRSMSIQRFRFVGDGLTEVLSVTSHVTVPLDLELRLGCAADFADLFEVKRADFRKLGRFHSAHDPATGTLVFEYEHSQFTAASRVHRASPPWSRATTLSSGSGWSRARSGRRGSRSRFGWARGSSRRSTRPNAPPRWRSSSGVRVRPTSAGGGARCRRCRPVRTCSTSCTGRRYLRPGRAPAAQAEVEGTTTRYRPRGFHGSWPSSGGIRW